MFFFKNGPFPASFSFSFRLFYKQLTAIKCSIKVSNDWIRTRYRYRKRPLCQLRHNHCPTTLFTKELPEWSHNYKLRPLAHLFTYSLFYLGSVTYFCNQKTLIRKSKDEGYQKDILRWHSQKQRQL